MRDPDEDGGSRTKGEGFYRELFQVSSAVMFLISPDTGHIVDANAAAAQQYGWSIDELRSMRITDINMLTPDEVRAEMENARTGRRGYFRFRHRTATGSVRHVEVHSNPVEIGGRHLLLSIIHDVTDRDELEEQLRRAQRLESIGRLAGGIAHDFNNLLTIMLTSVGLLGRHIDASSALRQHLDDLEYAARRAAELTSGLLAFGGAQMMRPVPFDLCDLIERTARLLRRTFPPTIAIHTELSEDVPLAHADPGQLEQAIMNLALNARDAMPEGGTLTLSCSAVELGGDADVPRGRWLVLTVADTGVGMDAAVRDRAFEPFFTTKSERSGTGLGLSRVYGIVSQSGGHIRVKSEPGEGTTFTIFLQPATAAAPTRTRSPIPLSVTAGRRTVLLVEDVSELREVLAGVLVEAGFRVVQAASAEQALELPGSRLASIDALVSDVLMPGRSGIDLAAELLVTRPQLPVMLISGHVGEHERSKLPDHVVFLRKPFVADDLVRALCELLGDG